MNFSSQQIKAIEFYKGICLVIAVPGAGKTTVILHRILNLINNHKINPENILSITFSKNAAVEMKNRFSILSKNKNIPNFMTIHAFSYSILKQFYSDFNKFTIYDINDTGSKAYKEFKNQLGLYFKRYITYEEMKKFTSAISFVKSRGLNSASPAMIKELDLRELNDILKIYNEVLKKYNYIDFDDLLIISNDLLNNENLLKKITDQYKFIILDEAQDTSTIQWKIIQKIISKEKNFFAVADDDQSIYYFRGAEPKYIWDFKSYFSGSKILHLDTNYRSTPQIIKSADNLIKNNEYRQKKDFKFHQKPGSKIKIKILKDRLQQYSDLIKNIKENKGNHAIIYRNNVSSLVTAYELTKNGIPFSMKNNSDVTNHFIFKDIINIIKFTTDPNDINTFELIFKKIGCYFNNHDFNMIKQNNNYSNLYKSIISNQKIEVYKRQKFSSKMDFFNLTISNFKKYGIDLILNDVGYIEYLENIKRNFAKGIKGYLRIIRALQHIANDSASAFEFLSKLKYTLNHSTPNSNLSLMTIHGAKGLEFDNVYLIDIIEDEIPGYNDEDLFLEEERRLLYVGMTRAKNNLTIYSYKKDQGENIKSSRFISEILQ